MKDHLPPRKPRGSPRGFVRKGRQGRETILLVEDEEKVRNLLCEILAEEGYRIIAAGDGEEALTASEAYEGPIHLLITDVMMPVMNGKELADRLCALRPDIKVLFITGLRRYGVDLGDVCEDQTDFLPKPFSGAQFQRKVREVLDTVSKT